MCWCCRPILQHRRPLGRQQCLSVGNGQDGVSAQRLWILTKDRYSTRTPHAHTQTFPHVHSLITLAVSLFLLPFRDLSRACVEKSCCVSHLHTQSIKFFACQPADTSDGA